MFTNQDEVIDSRDIIKRIDELTSQCDDSYLNYDEYEELCTLSDLAEKCSDLSSDWEYGEALIRHSYWVDYVQEMLEDCGELPKGIPWYIAIDWEQTAESIAQDYSSVDFDGQEYLIRRC